MPVADELAMRWPAGISTIAALLAAAPASAEPLAEVTARLGVGVAAGGGAGRATVRRSPVVATFDGAYAINAEPHVWGFAGLVIETYDRTGVGIEGGLMLPVGRRGRARVGARSVVRPYTLHGAVVGASWCWPAAPVRACADLEGDVYIAGTDLPTHTAVAQLIVAVGVTFDAW